MPPRTPTASSYPIFRPIRCLSTFPARFLPASAATTSNSAKGQIPPESPKFISVPRSAQEQAIYRPFVKGILPVPRQIFPRKMKKDKTSIEYLLSTTPEPKPSSEPPRNPTAASLHNYRTKQAAARRANLREGLIELHQRKQRIDRRRAKVGAMRHAYAQKQLYAPIPDDERLTRASVPRVMRSPRGALPDPDRAARVQAMRERTVAKETQRRENQCNMLHTLYMNARSFIVTPEQLDQVIDREFDDLSQFNNDNTKGENVWNLGYPETVQQLLANLNKSAGGKAVDRSENYSGITTERLDRIAEELTGGKMDDVVDD